MQQHHESFTDSRRQFLNSFAAGAGGLALASLLQDDGFLEASRKSDSNPPFHFAPKAKACIFIYLIGGPSQMDLFDPKPKLNEMHGEKLPESMMGKTRFAFIEKDSARLMGSPRKFQKYGQCGMDFSDLLPNLGTCADDICMIRSMQTDAFNHHPGELMMNTGVPRFGHPSIGSWLNYGLGSEASNLPGYVVLTAGTGSTAGASSWSSGFLPSNYHGVLFRNKGEAVYNLSPPKHLTPQQQRTGLYMLEKLNRRHYEEVQDPEIIARIKNYELAFRMQKSVPSLVDISTETQQTIDSYGLNRTAPNTVGWQGGTPETFHNFSKNCLLARRLVERGVRFVNLYHATWDHHTAIDKHLSMNCQLVDQPVAALLKDLKQRGLLDETLVVWASEFGRTPLGENKLGNANVTGRDHHPRAFTIWMAGGGVQGGKMYGKSDELGWDVAEKPVHVRDFHATLLHLFGLDQNKLTYRFQGRDARLTDTGGHVVHELLA
ncbi:MAG: hypothetical protein ACI9HK_001097 [Pirellulaceae bacterium]|jgi:hypothetical protein